MIFLKRFDKEINMTKNFLIFQKEAEYMEC